jgi:hypothetical protein
MSLATRCSLPSRVQRAQLVSRLDARRFASTHAIPRPKASVFDEPKNLVLRSGDDTRQRIQIAQDAHAISQIATCKLTYDERVHQHCTSIEEFSQRRLAFP